MPGRLIEAGRSAVDERLVCDRSMAGRLGDPPPNDGMLVFGRLAEGRDALGRLAIAESPPDDPGRLTLGRAPLDRAESMFARTAAPLSRPPLRPMAEASVVGITAAINVSNATLSRERTEWLLFETSDGYLSFWTFIRTTRIGLEAGSATPPIS